MIDWLMLLLVKSLLWLRYRVRVRGIEAVAAKGRRGILFLPNHPALIDPIIVMSRLLDPFRARALADRHQIDRFFIRRLAKRVNVLPIPDLAKGGSAAEVRTVIADCVEALRASDSLVLYPAGGVCRSRLEAVGGNSAVERILRELPDVRVVLVRTRGLWGSRFSWAAGREPSVGGTLWRGIKALLLSGMFFAPRRRVDIELLEPADLPRTAERREINRYLEAFYNAGAPPNTYVPYTPWERGGTRTVPEPSRRGIEGDAAGVPAATREIVRTQLEELTGAGDCRDDDRLAADLGLDSLARLELVTWLQQEFGFPQGNVDSLVSVGDVMLAACGEAVSVSAAAPPSPPRKWLRRPGRPGRPGDPAAMTIPEAFLAQARRAPGQVIVADERSGGRTYRQLVLAAMLLRREIARLPGHRVGIMLPASVAAVATYLATLLAGKTPVMVNWTLGRKHLRHGIDAVGVERILTSRLLVQRLGGEGVDLGAVAERCIHLEDVAAALPRRRKLAAALAARLSWRSLRRALAEVPPTAAILFTSGSESVPKAVPLTHRNMLANLCDTLDCFTPRPDDVALGILPPFHSFGLTAGVLLPLCLAIPTVFSPNPTEGAVLGQVIEAYKATILIGTPTFLHGIVRASNAEQLTSLRLVVTGAEKCTPRVYDALARRCPQTVVLEGYGVTECSPIISANHEDDARAGTIGKVFASLDHAIIDPATGRAVAAGATGMLLVRGATVFDGYLGEGVPSPFVDFDGHRWYRTGDLVSEDADGVLTFRGRLKRFVKLGGEMVSLPAIEAVLTERFSGNDGNAGDDGNAGANGNAGADDGPALAVTAGGEEGRPEIVLFTVKALDRRTVNDAIRAAGLSGLHNIRRVILVDQLPLLGTGKIDYRALATRLGEPGP